MLLQVAAKRAQRLLQALFVADVDQHASEHAEAAALLDRHRQTGLDHEREQPDGLQRDGFPAGVRPGDDQQVEVVAQSVADGHHVGGIFVGRAPAADQVDEQWVACQPDIERRLGVDLWTAHLELVGEPQLGDEQIEHRQRVKRLENRLGVDVDLVGQLPEQSGDFLGLFAAQIADLVVQLDGLGGLDVDRRAAVGAAVDDTGQAAAVFGPHREDQAIVVKGIVGELKQLARIGVV